MIFYFSGTGNSYSAAKYIAQEQGSAVYDMAKMLRQEQRIFIPEEGEAVGFVFPVYAWGPPEAVLEFIHKSRLVLCENYVFTVMTCGQDIGDCGRILRLALERAGVPLHGQFSVVMPDNFNIGYELDAPEKQKNILEHAVHALEKMNEQITARSSIEQVEKGIFPRMKSRAANPLFRRFFHPQKKFAATEKCISCGLCQRICPAGSITLNTLGRPVWGEKCYSCLGCINRCPAHAIEYGKVTVGRRRYIHPGCGAMDEGL